MRFFTFFFKEDLISEYMPTVTSIPNLINDFRDNYKTNPGFRIISSKK
jgi:hypothetical protein